MLPQFFGVVAFCMILDNDLKNKDDPKNEDNLKITLIFFDDLLPYGHTTTDVRPKIIPEMEFHMINIL